MGATASLGLWIVARRGHSAGLEPGASVGLLPQYRRRPAKQSASTRARPRPQEYHQHPPRHHRPAPWHGSSHDGSEPITATWRIRTASPSGSRVMQLAARDRFRHRTSGDNIWTTGWP